MREDMIMLNVFGPNKTFTSILIHIHYDLTCHPKKVGTIKK